MRAFTSLAIAVFAAVVSASSHANPFNVPQGGYTFTVGQATTLNWTPTTGGTVSLRLQHGDVTTANTGMSIVSGIPNDGSYTWTVPADVTSQPYTIEIISDNNPNDYNFMPKFTISGASASATPSSSAAMTSSSPAAMTSSAPASTTSMASSSAPSTMTTMTPSTSASASTTSMTSSSATPTTTKTESSTSSSAAASSSVPTTNAGITNRVSGGMLAMVAGAIAML